MAFSFDPDQHQYLLNGLYLPSVTRIISPLHDFGGISPEALQRKADWGTKIHLMIKLYLNGTLNTGSLSAPQAMVLQNFQAFERDYHEIFKLHESLIEMPMYHSTLNYAGTPDIFTGVAGIDIKTRPYNSVVDPLQLSAYNHIYADFTGCDKCKQLYVLSLYHDKPAVLQACNDKQAWNKFRYLLDNYNREKEFLDKIKVWKETT
jgi:hypothetical protein